METLTQIWQRLANNGYKSDKGDVHSYLPVYEKLLAPYRHTAFNVLEIGLFNGDSLRMWSEYFTKAKIYGIDCSLTPHDGMADLRPICDEIRVTKVLDSGDPLANINIHIFDAENVTEVSRRFFGTKFDVIIEDANHSIEQQINLFKIWVEYLHDDGIYIIEDIQEIDKERKFFEDYMKGEVYDLRQIKNRYDDVLIVIK